MEDTIIAVGRALLFALKGLQCQIEAARMQDEGIIMEAISDQFETADRWFQLGLAEIALDALSGPSKVPAMASKEDSVIQERDGR
jgi:hypothetical protein